MASVGAFAFGGKTMFKKLALSAAGTLALAGLASYAYVTLVPPAAPPTMPSARGFFSPAEDTLAEPSPETQHFTKGKQPSLPLPDTAQPTPAHPSAAPAPNSDIPPAEPGIAFRESHKRPINFGAGPQSAPTPAYPAIQTPAPHSLLTGGGKTKPAPAEGPKPTTPTTPEPTPATPVAPVAQATPATVQPTAQANGASPSAPKRPRAKSPFTYEEELYRAQYGWQAFAEKMRAAALNPEPGEVK